MDGAAGKLRGWKSPKGKTPDAARGMGRGGGPTSTDFYGSSAAEPGEGLGATEGKDMDGVNGYEQGLPT